MANEIIDLGGPANCELCGDAYHAEQDDREWMGLKCPGGNATDEDKATFRSALAETYAAEVRRQAMITLDADTDYLARRHVQWEARERTDGKTKDALPAKAQVSVALQEDCDRRTDTEVSRQKLAEVFQEQVFEIEVPHLTVSGKVPQGSTLVTPVERVAGASDRDYEIYLDPPPAP